MNITVHHQIHIHHSHANQILSSQSASTGPVWYVCDSSVLWSSPAIISGDIFPKKSFYGYRKWDERQDCIFSSSSIDCHVLFITASRMTGCDGVFGTEDRWALGLDLRNYSLVLWLCPALNHTQWTQWCKRTNKISKQHLNGHRLADRRTRGHTNRGGMVSHLKCRSLKVKCVSTMPVVFTLVLNTSCWVGM